MKKGKVEAVKVEAVESEAVEAESEAVKTIESKVADFLKSVDLKVEQSIDHLSAYNRAIEVFKANNIEHSEISVDQLTGDETGFALVQKWFSRLGFAEVMSSEAIYNDKITFETAKYKKATGSNRVKLIQYLNSLNDKTIENLPAETCKSLLLWRAIYRSNQPKRATGNRKSTGFKAVYIDASKKPTFKGDRADFLSIVESLLESGAEISHDDAASQYQALREKRGPVGDSTYEQQYSKMKTVLRDAGYCEIVTV